MKYIINNEKSIKNTRERSRAKEIIKRQMGRLERITGNYPKPVTVDFYFNTVDRNEMMVSAVVNLRGDIIFLKEKGQQMEALLHDLFDR